jgi:serine/threonine protein kinase
LKSNCVNWPQMIRLCYCLLEGLAYLHNENVDSRKSCAVAHRDLKSKNILVKNGGYSCCIGDFGLALKLNNTNKLSSAEIRSKVNDFT